MTTLKINSRELQAEVSFSSPPAACKVSQIKRKEHHCFLQANTLNVSIYLFLTAAQVSTITALWYKPGASRQTVGLWPQRLMVATSYLHQTNRMKAVDSTTVDEFCSLPASNTEINISTSMVPPLNTKVVPYWTPQRIFNKEERIFNCHMDER